MFHIVGSLGIKNRNSYILVFRGRWLDGLVGQRFSHLAALAGQLLTSRVPVGSIPLHSVSTVVLIHHASTAVNESINIGTLLLLNMLDDKK